MKILLLLLTLCPVAVFATTAEVRNSSNTVHYYHGMSERFFANGEYSQALVSVIEREISDNASYIIYRVLDDKGDRNYVVLLKKQDSKIGCDLDSGNNADCVIAPDLIKVYVPKAGQSITNIDEHNVTALEMRESGWGHTHQHRTNNSYTKRSIFLNFVYPGLGRVDANFIIKNHDDGSGHLYVKGSVGSDTDGLTFVWKSKMKLVFTMP